MKKSELTQLTQIIEHLVSKEIRKQLPTVIAEVFQNMMANKTVVSENKELDPSVKENIQEEEEHSDLKTSLRELFSGVTPVAKPQAATPKQTRQYTKNPVLNQILNETTADLRSRDRFVGAAAFHGGYSSAETAMPPAGETLPVGTPPVLVEGRESTHAPLAAIPQGISALDVAKSGMAPAPVTEALTNYGRMKAVLEASKKRR